MEKQQLNKLTSIFIAFVVLLNITGCSKSSDTAITIPSITTYNIINAVTANTAQVYAYETSYGGGALTAAGVCWSSSNQTPTISDSKTSNTIDTTYFAANLTGLTANTTYYVRAYATNAGGTAYGSVITFKTNTSTFATTATVSTFAGNGTGGFVNASGTAAQFYNPQGICRDASGNLYVADTYNNVIRKITSAGVVSTFAGSGTLGYVDATGTAAQFYAPRGLAIDASGNIYVSEMGNNMIRKITATGVVSTLAGNGIAGYTDGTGSNAFFRSPAGIAVDASGNVYVADRGNNVIRKITPAGVVTTLAGNTTAGYYDATGTAAYFNAPTCVAVDASGNVYVGDTNNYALRKITSDNVVTTVAGNAYVKNLISSPSGLTFDAAGNLYISDSSGRILKYNITSYVLTSLAGSLNTYGFANGVNTNAIFNSPQAITLDAQGNIYVADYNNHMIRKVTVTTTP